MLRKSAWMLGILISVWTIFLWISRSELYTYDVSLDHAYDFSNKEVVRFNLTLDGGVVHLPKGENFNKSSFLKVSVNSTLLSHLIRPSINMRGLKSTETQFFEHGAAGIRYLNISNLMQTNEDKITLDEYYITVSEGDVELIQFENPPLDGKRILILSPHPDDAEIASFGLYSNHDDTYIVTITSGDAGPFLYDEVYDEKEKIEHYLKKGEVRTWNSLAVPMLGGVPPENIINLGYNDARIRAMFRDRDMIAEGIYTGIANMDTFRKQNNSNLADGLKGINNWKSLVDNLVFLVEEIKPDIIITPSPMIDQHSDHQYTTIAAIEALKTLDQKEGLLFLYTNHLKPFNERYPYGDAGAVISLPPTPNGSNYFNSVYSHSTTPEQQRDKIFALDAMSDLRPGTDYRYVDDAITQALKALWAHISGADETYFRRAIRSNEFFFVVDIEDIYDDEKLSKL